MKLKCHKIAKNYVFKGNQAVKKVPLFFLDLGMHKPLTSVNQDYKPRSKVWLICLPINLTQIEFDNVFGASSRTVKVRVSYLDVRNQAANCRLKFSGFKWKNTVLVIYEEIEKSKESTNKVFRDLKARNKVRMTHFKS